MPRWITDIGLAASVCLLTLAFAPQISQRLPAFLTPAAIAPAAVERPQGPTVPAKSAPAANQKTVDELRAQLATAQAELTKAKLQIALSELVLEWGVNPPNAAHILVDTSKIMQYKDKLKIILIVRGAYANVDRMTDTAIGKSPVYTISGAPVTLIASTAGLKPSGGEIEFDLAGIPPQVSPNQILSLEDVEKLGGLILAGKSTSFSNPNK